MAARRAPTTSAPKVRTAIVLQGGGALGAYEYGVLKALYEQRPGFAPAIVSGTSIGAITAAVLGGAPGDPMAALDRLWREKLALPRLPAGAPDPTAWWTPDARRALAALGNPGMYRIRPEWLWAPWACESVYSTAPLRATLASLVDLGTLNSGAIRVIVGAVDVATAEARYFDSTERPLTFEDVAASGSLPPGFPPTSIAGRAYWDGGLFTNTPLGPAINALEACDGGDRAVIRELIVVELFPMDGEVPATMPDVLERMVELQYTSRLRLDKKFFRRIGAEIELFERIDAALPAGSSIRDDEAYRKLRAHRRIDRFTVVSAQFPRELANASDFSPTTIDARIRFGYRNAVEAGLGTVGSRRPVPVG